MNTTPVKPNRTLNWLVPLAGLLALVTSAAGLFVQGGPGPRSFTTLWGQVVNLYGKGVYQNDTVFIASGLKGADAVVLLAALPLLFLSWRAARRSSLRGAYLLTGVLSYILYIGMSLAFSAAFNRLFLVYVALFSTSLFALVITAGSIDFSTLPDYVSPRLPRRGLAIFLFIAGIGTLFIWLSDVLGPILSGTAPANLGPYTTMFTHAFDSGIITPVAVVAGLLILRRKPLGLLLAPPILLLSILNGLTVIASTISQTLAGLVFPPGVYIGMIGSWVVMGAFAVGLLLAFFRSIREGSQLKG